MRFIELHPVVLFIVFYAVPTAFLVPSWWETKKTDGFHSRKTFVRETCNTFVPVVNIIFLLKVFFYIVVFAVDMVVNALKGGAFSGDD